MLGKKMLDTLMVQHLFDESSQMFPSGVGAQTAKTAGLGGRSQYMAGDVVTGWERFWSPL